MSEVQAELALKFAGSGMESLDLMAEAAEKGEYLIASEIAASLAKNLMDISRALMAQAILEKGEE